MHPLYKVILFIVFLSPSSVFAATQGTLGTTSTGTVNISITIPSLVQICGLNDITLGTTSTFPATGATTAAIYSNTASPAGSYLVTASSANASGTTFQVANGSHVIAYSAFWGNTSATSPSIALQSGVQTVRQTGGSNSNSFSCSTSANANFNISFTAAQVQGAPPSLTYTDTVTILINP